MRLVWPNEKYLKFYQEAFDEYNQHKVDKYSFHDTSKCDVIKLFYNNRKGIGLKEGWFQLQPIG